MASVPQGALPGSVGKHVDRQAWHPAQPPSPTIWPGCRVGTPPTSDMSSARVVDAAGLSAAKPKDIYKARL
eukprot:1986577-Lingulodinium_polyedra.AAC.1